MTTRAFGTTPAGTITKEQTLLSIARLPVSAGLKITAGQVLCLDAATGYLIVRTAALVDVENFVALADTDNTGGISGALSCPLAVRGHYVTVVADGVINPGDYVKAGSDNDGQVQRFIPGTDDRNLLVGLYTGKEGGKISKATTTPYLESFTDQADFIPVACAEGDVIEVRLI
jgi:hypothetical protein